jgi:dolichol-phosphate mannosyltransferase
LVLVDDCSSDGTFERLEEARGRDGLGDTVLLRHERNRGLGAAMRTGFEAAVGDVVCTMAADCPSALEELSSMVDLMIRSDADIVTGSPYGPFGASAERGVCLPFLNRAASRLYSLLSPTKLHSYTTLFRAYRAEWARSDLSESNDFLAVTETLISAALRGARIVEFPVMTPASASKDSNVRAMRTLGAHLALLGKTALIQSGTRAGFFSRDSAMRFVPEAALAHEATTQAQAMAPIMDRWALVGRVGHS